MNAHNTYQHIRQSLVPVPPGYTETRLTLHRLAAYVISPACRRVTGKIGLRATPNGFGTPVFGADEQVRVDGTGLRRDRGDRAWLQPIASLGKAAAFILGGPPDVEWAEGFDVPAVGSTNDDMPLDAGAARFLADWYGFAWSVLEELRADTASVDASGVQLWPEHFDAAFDCLPAERRATFGVSPGDAGSEEPYLYVTSAAVAATPSPLWNATAFEGAVLSFADLVNAADQRRAALEFFRTRRALLV